MEHITQNSCDRRHTQFTIPPALTKDKEKKQEQNQKIQPKRYREQRKTSKSIICGFCRQQNWSPQHNYPAKTVNATIARK